MLKIQSWEEGIMEDPSFGVAVLFMDLNGIIRGVRHSYSEGKTLIKYSKEIHSPISTSPSNTIQLGTTGLYGEKLNSKGLIKDTSEGLIKENFNRNRLGSRGMEIFKDIWTTHTKQKFMKLVKLKSGSITWSFGNNHWLYCTSIDPIVSSKRDTQMQETEKCYNFMTKILNPDLFAKQLSRDIAKQIDVTNDLKCDNQEFNSIFQNSRKNGKYDYIIRILHGPIVYTNTRKYQDLFIYASQEEIESIMLFVKDKKYKVQQEYRFVVEVMFHSPCKDKYYLTVSNNLRRLMSST